MPAKRAKKTSPRSSSNQELSYDAKMIIVVLLLLLFYPLGVIFMWLWMEWPAWVKTLITIPVFLFFLMVATFIFFMMNVIRSGTIPSERLRTHYYPMMQTTPQPSTAQYRYY